MPEMEMDDLTDFAVLLAPGDYNRYGRRQTTDLPIEIRCKWVEDITSQGGADVDTEAVVGQVYVDRDISIDSVLWHGRLANFPRDWENDNPSELVEVSNFHKVPDVEDRCFRRWCDVTRYRDELPETSP